MVVVTGMRQTGKTTLLEGDPRLKGRRYFTFDDYTQLEAARQNPEALLAGEDPISIDEVQKCPEILTSIKRMIDRGRRPGRFLLSGSANFALLRSVSESLAGRAVYLALHPFGRREILGEVRNPPFIRSFFDSLGQKLAPGGCASLPGGGIELVRGSGAGEEALGVRVTRMPAAIAPNEVLTGGMPPVCLGAAPDRSVWFNGFEQTYLERDLRSLSQVADLVAFRRLMRLAALRTGQMLNQSGIGRDAHLNAMTASRYLGLLETSFIVHRIPPYLGNRASRLMKSPKLYFADAGLAAHLAGVADLDSTKDEPMRGALIETYVAQNILAILAAHWPEARLHFWQVHGRHEVDFVIEAGRECLAIEVKSSTQWGKSDLQGLEAFLDATPRCRAAILACNGADAVHLKGRLWAIPLGLLLS